MLTNVTWRYEKQKENVLEDANVTIYKGQAVGFIGSSGSGKTTLVDIILGVIQPIYGEVKMDGYNIIKIPDTWGKLIGYVPQNIFLLDDTIRNNVKFGVDCNDINDKIV